MVIDGTTYVLARTTSGRPACQHRLSIHNSNQTACGYDMQAWSREYTKQRFETILCRNKACHE